MRHFYGKPMKVMLTASQLRLIDNALISYSAGFGLRQDGIAKIYQNDCQAIRDIIKPIISKED
jgi:hypothetical protein